jgi:hypothetical protein
MHAKAHHFEFGNLGSGFASPAQTRLLLVHVGTLTSSSFLEDDYLVRVAHALALVGLRRTISANFGRHLPDDLLVDPLDNDFGLGGRFHLDACWHVMHHRVGETQRQVEFAPCA